MHGLDARDALQMAIGSNPATIMAASPAGAAQTAPSWRLASHALLRFATLPPGLLAAMRPTQTLAAIDAALAAEATLAALAPLVTDGLFQLVGQLPADDRQRRRAALQLKREVFAGIATRLDAPTLHALTTALAETAPAAADALQAWLAAQAAQQAADQDAGALLATEIESTVRAGLRAPLADPLFRRALAMASPDMAAQAARAVSQPTGLHADQFERSLLSYLIRATAKTSPFSSFMATSVAALNGGAHGPPVLDGIAFRFRTRINRGLLARIQAVARQHLPDDAVLLRANPTLRAAGPGRYRVLADRPLALLGRPWRQQGVATFQLQATLAEALATHAALGAAGWRDRFIAAGISAERAATLPRQLLDRGLLCCDPLTDAHDPDPAAALEHWLASTGSPLAANVREMAAQCSQIARADSDAAALPAGIAALRSAAVAALGSTGGPAADGLHNMVLDDCWAEPAPVALGHDQLPGLDALAGFLGEQIGLSPIYARLRDLFVARFGSGGRCTDVLDFLIAALPALGDAVEYGARHADTPVQPAPAGARLPVTVQLQRLREHGTEKIVVNKVFEGPGWLAARFGFGPEPGQQFLRGSLVEWLNMIADGREAVDVTVSGDCNDLQAHPRLLARSLRHGTDIGASDDGHGIDLTSLVLVHDTHTGLLMPQHADGRPIALFYLGATLPSPTWGVPYGLALLAQPYQLMRPPFQPGDAAADDIRLVPRTEIGQAILKRATWWVRTAFLARHWFAPRGAERLKAVRRSCRAQGLPPVFFARRPLDAGSGFIGGNALDARRKPMWIDTANPFCLDLLERLADGVEWISFTEALPDANDPWLTVAGRGHASELQIEMLLERG